MTPKSEEIIKTDRYPKLEDSTREKQRPPIYNPEDYAFLLKKWGKKSSHGIISLYSASSMSDLESTHSQRSNFRDYRNPMLSSVGVEMTLRQFGTVSELLAKLKCDLRLAYPSFVQEFVADPLDGVTLLLDLLRAIQLSQSNNSQVQQTPPGGTTPKLPPALQRRTLLDELSCLQCLHSCCMRYSEAVRKLTTCSAGLFTLAICIMSNVNKSRIIALQLLSKACESPTNSHTAVSEAMSTLRLRFGEPVRFRFLVGMLSSAGSHIELLSSGLKFLNTFLKTAGSVQKRVYLQAELEQAGFDLAAIKKNIGINLTSCEPLLDEMSTFEKYFIDVESLTERTESAEKENDNLKDKLSELEQKIQVLQEEKGILISMDQCLREKCSELSEEVHSLKSAKSVDELSKNQEESSPEDEGISSSERTPSPEDDLKPTSPVFELYKAPEPNQGNESEEETTIEEVIQELRDIISNEETEAYNRENSKLNDENKINSQTDQFGKPSDFEIIPSNLLPEPPRKTRSLIHLFIPTVDYECDTKEYFFDTESVSTDSSFSLVDVSNYCPPLNGNKILPYQETIPTLKRKNSKVSIKRSESFRQVPKVLSRSKSSDPEGYTSFQYNESTLWRKTRQKKEQKVEPVKCKSVDRLSEHFESFVNVISNDKSSKTPASRSKSDSGNISGTSVCRSVSNVYVNQQNDIKTKLSSYSEDKHRMFLPSNGEENETMYYFPRIQERKQSSSSSFLLNRGYINAGLYSGQSIETHQYFSRNREVVGSDCRSSGKLTDYPSGLY